MSDVVPFPAQAKAAPHNLQSEQAVLGALLFDNGAYERLSDSLTPDCFFEPFHGRLFEAIVKSIRDGRLAEPNLIVDRFSADPAFVDLGGVRYLAQLVDLAPPAIHVGDYGRSVLEMHRRRKLAETGHALAQSAGDVAQDVREVADAAEREIFQTMEAARGQGGFVPFATALAGAVDNAAAAFHRDGGLAGLSTGLVDLDQKLGGLHPSDLLILAGRPSMGKTALACNVAFNVARRYAFVPDPDAPGGQRTTDGGRVGFFSLEMSAEQLAMRLLAEASGVSSDRLRKGQIDASEFGRVRDAAVEIGEAPLYIDATGGLSLSKLMTRARRLHRQRGLDLIVVDYLQLATADSARRDGNRVQEVSEITMNLKALAKELNIPVLALSQLSRQVENREDKRPQLSDLRESGSIEQDADCVMFVYRESYYLARQEPKEGTDEHLKWQQAIDDTRGLAEVIIGKQRHGPIGTIKLSFQEDLTRFGNLARGHDFVARDYSAPRSDPDR